MIFGLIGEKLSHSYSPEIHKAIFELAGIEGEYRLFEVSKNELGSFLKQAHQAGINGLNVTIPFKTEIIKFIKTLSVKAKEIGAVNTITLKNELKGYNTDYSGIECTLLNNKITVLGKNALIAGSGGASKSVITYLMNAGIEKIFIASRNPKAINVKSKLIVPLSYEEITKYTPFDIIINATPVGMYPNTGISPIKQEHIQGADFLFDLIYNPSETKLMQLAEKCGIPNVNGLYMLVAQAVKAQEIWNGKDYGQTFLDSVYKKVLHS